MNRLLLALLVLPILVLTGCEDGHDNIPAVLRPASLVIEPIVNQYSDPDARIATYSTFAVLPRSVAIGASAAPGFGNELLEKQMLYALRNQLECLGYKFISDPSKSDFLVTIDGSNEYKSTYIPPSSITLPSYVPSQTIITQSYESGTASAYGTYGSAYGTYSGTRYTTTEIPGYWTTITYEVPGRTIGNYYPLVAITAFDCKTGRSVWYGAALGCSNNPDVRVSSQLLIIKLLGKMPRCEKALDNNPVGTGMLGVYFIPFSPDGDTIYPLVVGADKGKPAARAGLKFGDIILSIDGNATANRPFSEICEMIAGDVGTECVLSIARDKKVFNVKLKRVPRTSG